MGRQLTEEEHRKGEVSNSLDWKERKEDETNKRMAAAIFGVVGCLFWWGLGMNTRRGIWVRDRAAVRKRREGKERING